MKIEMRIGDILDRCRDWDRFCGEIGLNPWCVNEGLCSSDDEISIDVGVASKYGLFNGEDMLLYDKIIEGDDEVSLWKDRWARVYGFAFSGGKNRTAQDVAEFMIKMVEEHGGN